MKTKPQWIIQADEALKRAARRAWEVAARTRTPLHVLRDGRVVKVMPAEEAPVLRDEPPEYGTKQP